MDAEGEVIWFDVTKGYGFIRPDNPGPDVFFHHTGWTHIAKPEESQRVTYIVEEGRKGPEARHIRLEDDPPPVPIQEEPSWMGKNI